MAITASLDRLSFCVGRERTRSVGASSGRAQNERNVAEAVALLQSCERRMRSSAAVSAQRAKVSEAPLGRLSIRWVSPLECTEPTLDGGKTLVHRIITERRAEHVFGPSAPG